MPPTTRRTKTSAAASSPANSQHQQTLNFKSTTKAGNHGALPGKEKQGVVSKPKEKEKVKEVSPVAVIVKDVKKPKPSKKVIVLKPEEKEEEQAAHDDDEGDDDQKIEADQDAEKLLQPESDTTIPLLSPTASVEQDLSTQSTISALLTTFPTHLQTLLPSINDSEIHKYYNTTILAPRRTAPVHQEDLSLHEKVLRHFDLSSQYGPCIGITRLNRWKRAYDLGLNPPVEVLAVCVLCEKEDGKGTGSVVGKGKGMGVGKVEEEEDGRKRDTRNAYLDEFLSTRTAKE